jgi:hypothetical protein
LPLLHRLQLANQLGGATAQVFYRFDLK